MEWLGAEHYLILGINNLYSYWVIFMLIHLWHNFDCMKYDLTLYITQHGIPYTLLTGLTLAVNVLVSSSVMPGLRASWVRSALASASFEFLPASAAFLSQNEIWENESFAVPQEALKVKYIYGLVQSQRTVVRVRDGSYDCTGQGWWCTSTREPGASLLSASEPGEETQIGTENWYWELRCGNNSRFFSYSFRCIFYWFCVFCTIHLNHI